MTMVSLSCLLIGKERVILKVYDKEFLNIIKPIINHPEFLKRKQYMHHENQSVYEHSLSVAYLVFKKAKKKKKIDINSAVIGAILHDFYYKPWQNCKEKRPFFKKHGFVHAKEALENSKKFFPDLMNPIIENSILRHMFPLNIIPPKYKEGWILTLADKKDSLSILKHPSCYLKYLGLKKNKD